MDTTRGTLGAWGLDGFRILSVQGFRGFRIQGWTFLCWCCGCVYVRALVLLSWLQGFGGIGLWSFSLN